MSASGSCREMECVRKGTVKGEFGKGTFQRRNGEKSQIIGLAFKRRSESRL